VRFILEFSLSPHLADALHALCSPDRHEVRHIRVWFETDPGDPGWLRGLPERGQGQSVVVTADPNIYRNPGLRAAWRESGLTVVFLRSFADLPHWEQAARIVKWWPRIMDAVRRARQGAGFVVRVNGAVEPWTDD
jgi:hypothetical protein